MVGSMSRVLGHGSASRAVIVTPAPALARTGQPGGSPSRGRKDAYNLPRAPRPSRGPPGGKPVMNRWRNAALSCVTALLAALCAAPQAAAQGEKSKARRVDVAVYGATPAGIIAA